jgi:hypothetical protein
MSASSIFELGPPIDRLRKRVARLQRKRLPSDLAEVLPEFMGLPRYGGSAGEVALFEDFLAALDALPDDDRRWARLILGFDDEEEDLTSRRATLRENNGTAKRNRDQYVLQSVLHRMLLLATEGPPSDSDFDFGFQVLSVEVLLTARTRYPLVPSHSVDVRLRATRGGQRLIPLCYAGTRPLDAPDVVEVVGSSLEAKHLVSTRVVQPRAPFPVHLFWLSHAPPPGAVLRLRVRFTEVFTKQWIDVRSRYVAVGGRHSVLMKAQPRRSFDRADGLRSVLGSGEPQVEFRQRCGKKPKKGVRPHYVLWEARADDGDILELRCKASSIALERQRRGIKLTRG